MSSITENPYTGEFLLGEADGDRSRESITVASGEDLDAGAVVSPALTGTASAVTGSGNGTISAVTIGKNCEVGAYTFTCKELTKGTATATGAGPTGTGNGTIGSITLGDDVEVGTYTITCTGTGPDVASTGTSAGPTGTGNGTITATPATGSGCKVGVYRITCIGEGANVGDFSVQDPDGIEIGIATVAVEFTTHLTFTIADGATDFVGGDYFTVTVAAADSGTWKVVTPSGIELYARAYTGTAYTSDHVNFTISDGSTDFAADDYFTIAVVGNKGKFAVRSPSGNALPDLDVGVAYSAGDHLGLTVSDGSTDFAVADYFTVTVAEGAWEELDPSATDGTQIAKGILYGPVDASAAAASGVAIVRDAVVQDAKLQWPTGITSDQKTQARTELANLGVKVRT